MNTYIKTFTSLPVDFLILGVIFAVILFIALKQGRSYLAAAIVTLYISSFFYIALPFTKVLTNTLKGSSNVFWIHIGIFLIFYVPVYFAISQIIMTDFGYGAMRYIRASLLTIVFIGLLLSIFYHFIPIESVYNFSPIIDSIFSSDMALNFWLLIPLVVLFF